MLIRWEVIVEACMDADQPSRGKPDLHINHPLEGTEQRCMLWSQQQGLKGEQTFEVPLTSWHCSYQISPKLRALTGGLPPPGLHPVRLDSTARIPIVLLALPAWICKG